MSKYQLPRNARATIFVPYVLALALLAMFFASAARADDANFLRYEIVATHPHDARTFTQGLLFSEGKLVEGSGLHGRSALTQRELGGKVLVRRALPRSEFGEGVATDAKRFVQLTWQSGIAHIYDLAFRPIGRYRYDGEGWGLTYDGQHWLMSDGSDRITLRDRDSFAPLSGFGVTYRGQPVRELNELEWAAGRLYANVWHTDLIARIDPSSGAVEGWLDLAALRKGMAKPAGWNEAEHVLNGIAWNPADGHFFVTGKCWPVLYELRLLPPG